MQKSLENGLRTLRYSWRSDVSSDLELCSEIMGAAGI